MRSNDSLPINRIMGSVEVDGGRSPPVFSHHRSWIAHGEYCIRRLPPVVTLPLLSLLSIYLSIYRTLCVQTRTISFVLSPLLASSLISSSLSLSLSTSLSNTYSPRVQREEGTNGRIALHDIHSKRTITLDNQSAMIYMPTANGSTPPLASPSSHCAPLRESDRNLWACSSMLLIGPCQTNNGFIHSSSITSRQRDQQVWSDESLMSLSFFFSLILLLRCERVCVCVCLFWGFLL